MAQLKRIGILSSARVQAVLMGCAGLIAGVLYAGLGAVYDARTGAVGYGTALAFLAILGMPVMFAVVGLVAGAIGALLYNLVAGWVGGIEVDLEH